MRRFDRVARQLHCIKCTERPPYTTAQGRRTFFFHWRVRRGVTRAPNGPLYRIMSFTVE